VDVVLHAGMVQISDALYNKGLARARVSDLSGAMECLGKSISINKNNTKARNLFGLVQYEYGYIGEALKNWVISSNLQRENNPAMGYIEHFQKNARALERLDDAIRIYNQALKDISQKSDDMAIIKLKQTIDINPKFVDALNLLTFCYLIQKDKAKAAATAERVLALDVNNTVALNYYNEVSPSSRMARGGRKRTVQPPPAEEPPINPYKKVILHERRNVNFHIEGILALVIGVVCTLGVMYILVFPALDRSSVAQLEDMHLRVSQTEQAYDELLEERALTISELEAQIFDLESNVEEWAAGFDQLERTFSILNAFELLRDNRLREAVDALGGVDADGLAPDIMERANEVRAVAYPQLAQQYYSEGWTAYFANDFEKARVDFERAYRYGQHLGEQPLRGDILYFLGWTYSQLDMIQESIHYFERFLEEFPNHSHNFINQARNRLNAIS